MLTVGDSCTSERGATAVVGPARATGGVGGGAGLRGFEPAGNNEEFGPDSPVLSVTTGGVRCAAGGESCYSWPVVVQGMGLSPTQGGWGHVDSNGRVKGGEKTKVEQAEEEGGEAEEERDALVEGATGDLEDDAHSDEGEVCSSWPNGGGEGDLGLEGSTSASAPEEEGVPGGPVLLAVGDSDEPLEGLPGERSLYSGIGNGAGLTGAATAAVTSAAGEAVAVSGVGGKENEEGEEGGGGAVVVGDGCGGRVECAPAGGGAGALGGAGAGADPAGTAGAGAAGLFGEVDDQTFDQSWNDLVEGVADEGVLHAHGRAGLPDPLPDDATVAGAPDAGPAALAVDGGCANGKGGGGGGSGGGGGGDSGFPDDGYGTNSEDQQGGLFFRILSLYALASLFASLGVVMR